MSVARRFVEDYNYTLPCVVDTMDNQFNQLFAVWPERYYVIRRDGHVWHRSMPHSEFGYNHLELNAQLDGVLNYHAHEDREEQRRRQEESLNMA